jgi:long-subunit acyl-CoA synthetase (AMP-forming)
MSANPSIHRVGGLEAMAEGRNPMLLDCFLKWEAQRRDRIYLTQPYSDGRVVDYTWREVGDQARRMAAYFKSLGLHPGSRVVLLGKNSAHWIIADLAMMMAGLVSVPLYPMFSAEAALYVIGHCDAKLLVLGKLDGAGDNWPNIRDRLSPGMPMLGLPQSPRDGIPQWEETRTRHAPLQTLHQPARNELCTIVYTSGSTGEPKGVMHSYDAMAAVVGALEVDWYGFNANDRMLSYLPLAHLAERVMVETPSLAFGFRLFFFDSLATFTADLQRARPTVFVSVPRLWTKFYLAVNERLPPAWQKRLFALPLIAGVVKRRILRQLGLDEVRVAISGSAPLPERLIRWYRSLGLELLEGYGMSENLAISHISRPGAVRIGSVGQPQLGVQARIGKDGEIEVRSPGQMLGYYKQPELTAAQTTTDGFFRTGDSGEIDAEGFLRITGRAKDIFKTAKGKYVAPVPIEAKLFDHPRFEAICVAGAGQPMPFALLLLSQEARQAVVDGTIDRGTLSAELAELRERVNSGLERHEALQYLVVVKEPWSVENGMLTPTLKIRRSAIEHRYLPSAEQWAALQQPVIWE